MDGIPLSRSVKVLAGSLANGLRIYHVPKDSNSVVILVSVRTGSNSEIPRISGISHFIEHLVFDATKKRPRPIQISNEIEKRGGDFNAATSNERTYFYISIQRKHFDVALDIMSDIILNPLFSPRDIEKEKKILVDEINMIDDQPRYYQWVLFSRRLFDGLPPGNTVYGSADAIRSITRKDILSYYRKHYVPSNADLVIVGGGEKELRKARSAFSCWKGAVHRRDCVPARAAPKKGVARVARPTSQAYLVLGYSTVPRSHPDSYALDVIKGHLGRGQSGRIFDVIRTEKGLAYDVGAHHNPSGGFGYFAVYVGTKKKNLGTVKRIILEELSALKKIGEKEIEDSKTYIEGDFMLQLDDSLKHADAIAYWSMADSVLCMGSYVRRIKRVTKKDIVRAVEKHFLPDRYTIAVIEPKS